MSFRSEAKEPASPELPQKLPQIPFTLAPGAGETFTIAPSQNLYADAAPTITSALPEVTGLTGIRLAAKDGNPLHFNLTKPAQILVGFLKSGGSANLSAATEQWNLLLPNAITPSKGQPISIWAKPLPAGANDLDLGKGAYVVLGFIPEDTHVTPHITFTNDPTHPPNLDWLFEN